MNKTNDIGLSVTNKSGSRIGLHAIAAYFHQLCNRQALVKTIMAISIPRTLHITPSFANIYSANGEGKNCSTNTIDCMSQSVDRPAVTETIL